MPIESKLYFRAVYSSETNIIRTANIYIAVSTMHNLFFQRRQFLLFGLGAAGAGVAASWIADVSNLLRSIAIVILLGMGLLSMFPKVSYCVFRFQLAPFFPAFTI